MKRLFFLRLSTKQLEGLLTNSESFWQPKFGSLIKCLQELFAVVIVFWQGHNVFASMLGQTGRQNQEIRADGIQSGETPILGKTQALEPVNDVGSKEDGLEKSDVGGPVGGWDLSQRIIVNQFTDVPFDVGSKGIEEINPPGSGLKIGDKDMVDVFFILEQLQLSGFLRIFRDGAADNHKTMFPGRMAMDFFVEFCVLPTIFERSELAGLRPGFDLGIFLGHDDVSAFLSVKELRSSLAVKPGIHSELDAESMNVFGYLGQADSKEWNDPCGRCSVAWA